MFDLDIPAIASQLHSAVPAFVTVGVARDLGAVRRETIRWPSAWVIPLAEVAGENRYASDDMIEQPITARVAIIMAVRDIADRHGARATTDLKPLRAATMKALGRYRPEGADTTFRFARGQLQSGIDAQGGLFWQDDYTLRFDRRIPFS